VQSRSCSTARGPLPVGGRGDGLLAARPRGAGHVYAELLEHGRVPCGPERGARTGVQARSPTLTRWSAPVGGRDHATAKGLVDVVRTRYRPQSTRKVANAVREHRLSRRGSRRCRAGARLSTGRFKGGALRALQEAGRGEVARPAGWSSCRAATVCVAPARAPTSRWRRSRPAPSSPIRSTQLTAVPPGGGQLVPATVTDDLSATRVLHQLLEGRRWSASSETTTRPIAGSVVKAMPSAKDGYPILAGLSRGELSGPMRGRAGAPTTRGPAQANWTLSRPGSTTKLRRRPGTRSAASRGRGPREDGGCGRRRRREGFQPGQVLPACRTAASPLVPARVPPAPSSSWRAWRSPAVGRSRRRVSSSLISLGDGLLDRVRLLGGRGRAGAWLMGATGPPMTSGGEDVVHCGARPGNRGLSASRGAGSNGCRSIAQHAQDVFKRDLEEATDVVVLVTRRRAARGPGRAGRRTAPVSGTWQR